MPYRDYSSTPAANVAVRRYIDDLLSETPHPPSTPHDESATSDQAHGAAADSAIAPDATAAPTETASAATPALTADAPEPAAPRVTAYRICRIASIRLALPAERLQATEVLPPTLRFATPSRTVEPYYDGQTTWSVMDLAQVVAPGVPRPHPEHLVRIAGTHRALACSLEQETQTLGDDQIHWREGGGRRPWLAGVAHAHACAIVDLDALFSPRPPEVSHV